jgi:hypothetical protein
MLTNQILQSGKGSFPSTFRLSQARSPVAVRIIVRIHIELNSNFQGNLRKKTVRRNGFHINCVKLIDSLERSGQACEKFKKNIRFQIPVNALRPMNKIDSKLVRLSF